MGKNFTPQTNQYLKHAFLHLTEESIETETQMQEFSDKEQFLKRTFEEDAKKGVNCSLVVKTWTNLGLHLAEKIKGAISLQTYKIKGGKKISKRQWSIWKTHCFIEIR